MWIIETARRPKREKCQEVAKTVSTNRVYRFLPKIALDLPIPDI
jgi:hypothetical protein